jgi:hypothetical protein
MGIKETHVGLWWGNVKKRDLQDLESKILKWVIEIAMGGRGLESFGSCRYNWRAFVELFYRIREISWPVEEFFLSMSLLLSVSS